LRFTQTRLCEGGEPRDRKRSRVVRWGAVGNTARLCAGRLPNFLLFADDKPTLWAWRAALVERLARLRLCIHPGAHPRPVGEGIPFLGFVIYPTHRRVKGRKAVAYRRRLRRLAQAYADGRATRDALAASLRGWINHVRYGDTWGLRCSVVRSLPPLRRGR
jgi:RNA-directed DNA polymerase